MQICSRFLSVLLVVLEGKEVGWLRIMLLFFLGWRQSQCFCGVKPAVLQCESIDIAVWKHRCCEVKAKLLLGEKKYKNFAIFLICWYSGRWKNKQELGFSNHFPVREEILHSCKARKGQKSISVEPQLLHDERMSEEGRTVLRIISSTCRWSVGPTDKSLKVGSINSHLNIN